MKSSDSGSPVLPTPRPRPSYLPSQESLSGIYGPKTDDLLLRLQQLEDAMAQQEKQIGGLLNIAASLRKSRYPEQAMRSIVVQISQLLQADRTTIYEVNEDTQMLQGLAVQGESSISVGIPYTRGLAGMVATSKRSINLVDAYDHPNFDCRFDKLTGYRTRSVLCVPMLNTQREVIGVVQVLNKYSGSFTQEDNNLLSALASQAAITLEALRLECALKDSNHHLKDLSQQVQQRLEEQELLFQIEQEISSSADIISLADKTLDKAASIIGSDLVGIFIPNEAGYGPAFLKELKRSPKIINGVKKIKDVNVLTIPRIEVGEGIFGKIASRGEHCILVGNLFEKEVIPRRLSHHCDYLVHNALCYPLIDGREAIGSLVFINCQLLDQWWLYQPIESHNDTLTQLLPSDFTPSQDSKDESNLQINLDRSLRFASLITRQLSRGIHQITSRENALQQDRMMTIGQMLSGVLHDMRGPMTSISGYTQVMARTQDMDKRTQMSLTVKKKIKDLNEMTREVMAFARGERTVFSRKVYLKQFTDHVIESMSPEFEEHGIELVVDLATKGIAYFDEGKMMRVVTNIARNARQAMGDIGRFTWTITRDIQELDPKPHTLSQSKDYDADQTIDDDNQDCISTPSLASSDEESQMQDSEDKSDDKSDDDSEDQSSQDSITSKADRYDSIRSDSLRSMGIEECLIFTLSDSGPGIPESIRERVFEAFTTSGKAEGTGLGLAIVKRIVDDHQGQIHLSTQTNVGTTFTIRIPQSMHKPQK
jgi:signal transduction histidine kinase/putative methionine-R-sulfoxide reductase with GAF domain